MKRCGGTNEHAYDDDMLNMGLVKALLIQRQKSWFSDNNRSAMLSVSYGECTLLAADVEPDAQNELLNTTPELLKADILKYPHHYVTKAGWNFLKPVGEELAVVANRRYSVWNTRKDAEKKNFSLVYT